MSLSTNKKTDSLGIDRLKNILKTFAKPSNYNFIWKLESEVNELPIKPTKNIFILKCLPSNDILANPKVKAFVIHARLFGTQESTWYGKLIVGGIKFLLVKTVINNKIKKFNKVELKI